MVNKYEDVNRVNKLICYKGDIANKLCYWLQKRGVRLLSKRVYKNIDYKERTAPATERS